MVEKEILKNQIVIMRALLEILKDQNKHQSEGEIKLTERIRFPEAMVRALV